MEDQEPDIEYYFSLSKNQLAHYVWMIENMKWRLRRAQRDIIKVQERIRYNRWRSENPDFENKRVGTPERAVERMRIAQKEEQKLKLEIKILKQALK